MCPTTRRPTGRSKPSSASFPRPGRSRTAVTSDFRAGTTRAGGRRRQTAPSGSFSSTTTRRWLRIASCGGCSRSAGRTPRSVRPARKIYFGTSETHPDGKPSPDAEPEIWFEKSECDYDQVGWTILIAATPEERASPWYETYFCTGCCFLTTTKLLEETGGFDEGLFLYYEDVDLSLQIRARGYLCAVIPSATSWHKAQQSTRNDAIPSYAFYLPRNLYLLAERHLKRPEEWRAFQRRYPVQVWSWANQFINRFKTIKAGATVLAGLPVRPSWPSGGSPEAATGDGAPEHHAPAPGDLQDPQSPPPATSLNHRRPLRAAPGVKPGRWPARGGLARAALARRSSRPSSTRSPGR